MGPRQAWGAFSLMVSLGVVGAAVALVSYGFDPLPLTLFAAVLLVFYSYVVYKRYHVEVVPERDIALFEDQDDLRILCRIYGLDDTGAEQDLRGRLLRFARENRARAYAWVAPKAVLGLGGALELRAPRQTPSGPAKALAGGKARSSSRLSGIRTCPVCDAALSKSGAVCGVCGADLEFYAALSESKVGRRLLSAKSGAVRRKLRYEVPYLGGDR